MHQLWNERDPRVPPRRRIDTEGHPTVSELAESIRSDRPHVDRSARHGARGDGEAIGYCGLVDSGRAVPGEPELAFELLRRQWGRGYATEASHAVMDWARSSGHKRLWATVGDWNIASRRCSCSRRRSSFRSCWSHPATSLWRRLCTPKISASFSTDTFTAGGGGGLQRHLVAPVTRHPWSPLTHRVCRAFVTLPPTTGAGLGTVARVGDGSGSGSLGGRCAGCSRRRCRGRATALVNASPARATGPRTHRSRRGRALENYDFVVEARYDGRRHHSWESPNLSGGHPA
ncbi:GNAT family N-acetyltransferase [Ornithinimicrobium sufpigmenti]